MGTTQSRNIETTHNKSLAPYKENNVNPIVQMTSRVIKSKEEYLLQTQKEEIKKEEEIKKIEESPSIVSTTPITARKAKPKKIIPKKLQHNAINNRLNLNSILFSYSKSTAYQFPSSITTKATNSKIPKKRISNPIKSLRPSNVNDCRISITHKAQPKFTDRVHFDKVSLLPAHIFYNVLSYIMNDVRSLLQVSPSWYSSVLQSLDEVYNPIENSFLIQYANFLLFTNSFTSSSKISCCKTTGTKVDRVLSCEVLGPCKGKTVTIGYSYCYEGEKERHVAEFQFECISQRQRVMWIHKNDCFVYL